MEKKSLKNLFEYFWLEICSAFVLDERLMTKDSLKFIFMEYLHVNARFVTGRSVITGAVSIAIVWSLHFS